MKYFAYLLAVLTCCASIAQGAQLAVIDQVQQEAFGIRTVPVAIGSQTLSKPYPARVAVPNAQFQVISAPLDGVLEALLVAEGEHVQAGQALARMRSQQLLELQAAYLESRTRRLLSGENLARDRKLFNEGIVAQRRLLETQAAHREMTTAEARDRQALVLAGMPETAIDDMARSQQMHTSLEIRSPISGVVLQQAATAGQRLAASDPLYHVGDLSVLWIEIHVPVDALGDVGPGDQVRLANGMTAIVITVGRMVHGTDQGVLVRAEIRDNTSALRPGQFVEAQITQRAISGAVQLPAPALVRIDGSDRVFVQRPNGFEAVPVEVLSREAEQVVVRGSFAPGDQVVVEGTVALKAALSAGAE